MSVPPRAPSQNGDFPTPGRVVELFAGVGGFHLALARSGWQVVWANQWEPSTKSQPAADCYERHFGDTVLVREDIAAVMDRAERDPSIIPPHQLLVGGFPCQDYSVAKTLNQAQGLVGKKGVLWWEIHRLLTLKRPPFLFLENVDRLLKSPAIRRGRDFAIMLASLAQLGYSVEWRVVNAADYGFPQKRRRVYIIGRLGAPAPGDPYEMILRDGVLARALPVDQKGLPVGWTPTLELGVGDLAEITEAYAAPGNVSPFHNAGYMRERAVWSLDVAPRFEGHHTTLREVLESDAEVPSRFRIPETQLEAWRYLKGAKREQRVHKASGSLYHYTEGPIPYPDNLDGAARTILTGEGGATASRFKHIIESPAGGYRRLTPRELERLDGFPDDWTATGMSDGRRAFCMGNALVVGVVERIGAELAKVAVPAATGPEVEPVPVVA